MKKLFKLYLSVLTSAMEGAGATGFSIGTATLNGIFPVETGEQSIQLKSIVNTVN